MSDEKKYPHLAAARKRLQELLALGKEKKAEIEATYSEHTKEEKEQSPMSIETKTSGPCPPPPQKKSRRSRSKKAPAAPQKSSHGKQSSDERSSGSSSRSSSSSSSGSSAPPRHRRKRRGEGSSERSRVHSHRSKREKKGTPPLPTVDNALKTSVPTADVPAPSQSGSGTTKEADIESLVKKRVEEEMARVHADVKQTVRQAQQQISLSRILAI